MNLYFIALIPDPPLREQVKLLKEEMRENYGAKHALKSPAHITLQMPFRRESSFETNMSNHLNAFCANQKSFPIALAGFSAFSPRVIYINISDHAQLLELHSALSDVLIAHLGFAPDKINRRFHPHMTIATRDLTASDFHSAWPLYRQRVFEAEFHAHSLYLLKHNGKYWDVYQSFSFDKSSITSS